mmetsp:Transcript_2520/g.9741  ORF Transcript_2520/g.9741 Transcript_2520/m.9741 type:complete len:574 (-) Transcript_2520:68-1789(-)
MGPYRDHASSSAVVAVTSLLRTRRGLRKLSRAASERTLLAAAALATATLCELPASVAAAPWWYADEAPEGQEGQANADPDPNWHIEPQDLRTTSLFGWGMLGMFLAVVAVFVALGSKNLCNRPRDRAPLWAVALLLLSHSLLVPGLVCSVFQYNIFFLDESHALTEVVNHHFETVFGFAHALGLTGHWYGAAFVMFYTLGLPVVRLGLFLIGEVWRNSHPHNQFWARRSILMLKGLSKWAAPDTFAYIFILCLVEVVPEGHSNLAAEGHLDIGFACFAVCSLGSCLAAAGIPVPDGDVDRADDVGEQACCSLRRPRPRKPIGTLVVTMTLAALFALCFTLGVSRPCAALRLQEPWPARATSVTPRPLAASNMTSSVPEGRAEAEGSAGPPSFDAEVSLWRCLVLLAQRLVGKGEANSAVALVLLAGCAALLPALNMCLLLLVAWRAAQEHCGGVAAPDAQDEIASAPSSMGDLVPQQKRRRWWLPCPWEAAKALRGLAMLDVAVAGLIAVVFLSNRARPPRDDGPLVTLSLEDGVLALLGAAVCHSVAFVVVGSVASPASAAATPKLQRRPSV